MADGREGMQEARYWEHVERPADAPRGFRVVEWLRIAYNQDAPIGWRQVAVYRPLDPAAFVYQTGGWDFRPLDEFYARYRIITDPKRIAELDAQRDHIYSR